MAKLNDWLIVPGRVLRLFCTGTKPPKEKFVVIVSNKPFIIGFLINTPTGFQENHQHLVDEMIKVSAKDGYNFLTHSSYLDCTDAMDFEEDDIVAQITAKPHWDHKMITEETRNKIVEIVENSLMLEAGIAKIILKNLKK